MARGKKSKAQKHHSESEKDEDEAPVAEAAVQEQEPPATAAVSTHDDDAKSDSGSDSGSDKNTGLSKAELKKKKEDMRAAKAKKNLKKKKVKDRTAKPAGAKPESDDKDDAKGSASAHPGPDGGGNSDGDEAVVVTRQEPVQVLYCPICTFPAEMCEFSGMMEKCRPWLQEHAADLADAEERGRKRRILTDKERLEAMVEGRGIKKAIERVVVIELEQRTGKRMITSVFGMDLFGFNLKDLSKEWRKTFCCGAGVRAPGEGKHQESVDIQGNVVDQLAELIVKKYKIPKDSIYTLTNKKKVPYF